MRPIDADALETKIQILLCEVQKHGFTPPEQIANLGLLLQYINKAPTIEAKPVVHAHWIKHREFYEDEGFEGYYYSCSNCDGTLYGDIEGFDFCHCCGAQMDEVVSDTNVGSKMDESISQAHENSGCCKNCTDHIAEAGKKEDNP